MQKRAQADHLQEPMAIYEMHLGSWMRKPGGQVHTYRELASLLVDYLVDLGYSHVEFMPIMEHPCHRLLGLSVHRLFRPHQPLRLGA